MNRLFFSLVAGIVLVASFFVFQNELSIFFVNLTKTKNVSFWTNVTDQPVWMLTKIRFVGLPPVCVQNGFNAYYDPQTFQDTGYCADVVCSNGTLSIIGTNSSECINPSSTKCSFGLLDNSTGLCVMNGCKEDSDCSSYQSQNCSMVCKPFGKGVFVPATNTIIAPVKVCSCQ